MKRLTPKQQRFCDEYIKSGNATKAYFEAGYKITSNESAKAAASRLLTTVNVQKYLKAKLKQLESKKIAGAREVLEYLTSVVRGEQTEAVATARGVFEGVPVSAKDRISAAKEILKRYPTDPLSAAQLRKLEADADYSEEKVKAMKQLTNEDNQVLSDLMNKVKKGVIADETEKLADK